MADSGREAARNAAADETTVLLLAGGAGLRLRPLTVSIPKPLLPLTDLSIGELICRRLSAAGFSSMHVAVHRHVDLVGSYFRSLKLEMDISVLREQVPLDTAGSLFALRGLGCRVIAHNADLLADFDYEDILSSHRASGAAMTVVGVINELKGRYGELRCGPDQILRTWLEKQTKTQIVSAGVSIIEPEVIRSVCYGEPLSMPELVARSQSGGFEVRVHTHRGTWFDLGEPETYNRAVEEFRNSREKYLPVDMTARVTRTQDT